MIRELNERSRTILRLVVESYLETGEPVGSRTISRVPGMGLSAASIRNVMQDLEEVGFLEAPHTSAGRQPTQSGLRFYVDGLMSLGNLSSEERARIEAECRATGRNVAEVFEQAGMLLSGLSSCASLVMAPKSDRPVRHVSFVGLSHGRVLVVLVNEDGLVENRIMEVPADLPQSSLESAANYLNEKIRGQTFEEARKRILAEIAEHRTQLDVLTEDLVSRGVSLKLAGAGRGHLIIRGTARLFEDVRAVQDLENARNLLEALESQETMLKLLESAAGAEGVQVFIGTENRFFANAGCSMVLSPVLQKGDGSSGKGETVIGAVGVIGPTRINYGRIVPMVDYTSRVIGEILGYPA
ncbi:MAG: heat-inducible transcriptional repressor HrcA [Alphaproteobacteria bacterium]|nr:heat-inducible transcriptional repressor HrcA [Alphaproteobacteria bacterium]